MPNLPDSSAPDLTLGHKIELVFALLLIGLVCIILANGIWTGVPDSPSSSPTARPSPTGEQTPSPTGDKPSSPAAKTVTSEDANAAEKEAAEAKAEAETEAGIGTEVNANDQATQSSKADNKTPAGDSEKDHTGDPAAGDSTAGDTPENRVSASRPQIPIASGPWDDVLSPNFEPPRFIDVCFVDFDTSKMLPQTDDLKQWFASVPGQPFELRETRTSVGQCAEFNGLMRLRAPLNVGAALKLSLTNNSHMRWHFFDGTSGVTVAFHHDDYDGWFAYQTERKGGEPRPHTMALAASDQMRARRTEVRSGGTFEFRHHRGHLYVTRGDIVLLKTPLEQPPDEVYFEGKAAFHGIALSRTKDFPPADEPVLAYQTVADIQRPADLEWEEHLSDGLHIEKHNDGAVSLVANQAESRGWISCPIPRHGVGEIVVLIEGATPGTGVFLQRTDDSIHENLRFLRDTASGHTCVTLMHGLDDTREKKFPGLHERVVPLAAGSQWLRILFCGGMLRWWMSTDGEHWAEPELPLGHRNSGVSRFGLMQIGKQQSGQIRLRRIVVRDYTTLASLTDAALLNEAPALSTAPSYGHWLAQATESQPQGIELTEWRIACAIRTIGAGCNLTLGQQLIELLLDAAESKPWPADRQLALLNEAAHIAYLRDSHPLTLRFLDRYRRLAIAGFQQRQTPPFSLIRRELQTHPFTTLHHLHIVEHAPVREEILQLVAVEDWHRLAELCRQLRFFEPAQLPEASLVEWAEATAARHLPRDRDSSRSVVRKAEWRHPLIEELDKSAYNMLAELNAVLASEAYEEAATAIAALDADALDGVARSPADPNLFVSLPTAVRTLLTQHKTLADVLDLKFRDVARLRIRTAIQSNHPAAIELATVQFAVCEPVAEAHRWLGDRALSSGWFLRALDQYKRAFRIMPAADRSEMVPRIRLAAAFAGSGLAGERHEGQPGDAAGNDSAAEDPLHDDLLRYAPPSAAPVRMNEVELTAAEFEDLIRALREQQRGEIGRLSAADDVPPVSIAPAEYELHRRGRLDGPVGDRPQDELIARGRQYQIDWVNRQLATAVDGDTMFAANRFQVAAYDLNTGNRRWQTRPPEGKKPLRSQDWGLIKMRPLVDRQRVYARMLYERGPNLTCWDRTNGNEIWTLPSTYNQFVVSDPLLIQGQLCVLLLNRMTEGNGILSLAIVDRQYGHLNQTFELLQLDESWWQRRCCEVAPTPDGLCACLGGVVLHCGLTGQLDWLRKTPVLPTAEEPTWVQQHYQAPLFRHDKLYVVQPGVRTIECLEAATGRLLWSCLLPEVQRIVGIAENLVVVETANGFQAVRADTGRRVWFFPATSVMHAAACTTDGRLFFSQRTPESTDSRIFETHLVWLELATGAKLASSELIGATNESPRLGQLTAFGDRLWGFYGQGHDDATRDLIELVKKGDASVPEPAGAPADEDVFAGTVVATLRRAAQSHVPGWTLLSGEMVGPAAIEGERWGKADVLGVRARYGSSAIWCRKVAIPKYGKPKLRIEVGNEPAESWRLVVRHGGQEVSREEITAGKHSGHWKTFDLDLTPRCGTEGWLIIEADYLHGGKHADLFWNRIELVF